METRVQTLRLSNMRWQPIFNVWLLAGYLPTSLCRAETVLIAKEAGTESPEKHRPITISDIILRCFHKVLAARLETLPWNKPQKAFMKGDGVADSIWLLQTIICQHQRTLQPLNIAFLDIKKAFDSVSHESLARCGADGNSSPHARLSG